jgi:hypothetical protein
MKVAKAKKVIEQKSNIELFDNRFNGRANLREYMNTLVPASIHASGSEYADFLKKNVFKHKNQCSFLEIVGVDEYVWFVIDKDTPKSDTKRMIEKLQNYGFFQSCYRDCQGWLFVPTSHYVGNRRAKFARYSELKLNHDGTIIVPKRIRK